LGTWCFGVGWHGHDHVCDLVEAAPLFEATPAQENRLYPGFSSGLRLAKTILFGAENVYVPPRERCRTSDPKAD
jgi:hypothetical protein